MPRSMELTEHSPGVTALIPVPDRKAMAWCCNQRNLHQTNPNINKRQDHGGWG